jgi:hypothetical protein
MTRMASGGDWKGAPGRAPLSIIVCSETASMRVDCALAAVG